MYIYYYYKYKTIITQTSDIFNIPRLGNSRKTMYIINIGLEQLNTTLNIKQIPINCTYKEIHLNVTINLGMHIVWQIVFKYIFEYERHINIYNILYIYTNVNAIFVSPKCNVVYEIAEPSSLMAAISNIWCMYMDDVYIAWSWRIIRIYIPHRGWRPSPCRRPVNAWWYDDGLRRCD